VTNINPSGWRNIFWIQAALHALTSIGIFAFYWPKKRTEYPRMSFKRWAWACDPIGSFLLIASATLMLLALNWAGGAYAWKDPHVCANLVVGIVLFIAFCLYGKFLTPASKRLELRWLIENRMEGKVRWYRCTCVLQQWSKLLACDFRLCCRRVSSPYAKL
jgi:MFS family permease